MVFKVGCENDSLKKGSDEKAYPLPGSNLSAYENVVIKKEKCVKKGICCVLSCFLIVIALVATSIYFGYRTFQYKRWNMELMESCQVRYGDGGLYDSYNLGSNNMPSRPNRPRPPSSGNRPNSDALWPKLASAISECVVGLAEEEVTDEVDQEDDVINEEDELEIAYRIDPECLRKKITKANIGIKLGFGLLGFNDKMQRGRGNKD